MKKSVMAKFSILFTVATFIIAVLVVLLTDALPTTITKIDTTETKIFTISEYTQSVLDELPDKVDIYLLASQGTEDKSMVALLEKYKSASHKVNVETIDPVINPEFASKYTDKQPQYNGIIVVYGKNSKYIEPEKIHTQNIKGEDVFNGEGEITGAISVLSGKTSIKVYAIKGHRENTLDQGLYTEMYNQGYDIEDLNLAAVEDIPQDSELIIINAPQDDFTEEDVVKLARYMKRGGSIFLTTSYQEDIFPNLNVITMQYGLLQMSGIILEGDERYHLPNKPVSTIAQVETTEVTLPILLNGNNIITPISHPIVIMDQVPEGINATVMLSTSQTSYHKTSNKDITRQPGDLQGPFVTGIMASKRVDDGKKSKLVWVSTPYAFIEEYNEQSYGANNNLFVNCAAWASGYEEKIGATPKRVAGETLQIEGNTAAMLKSVVIGVVPGMIIILGIIVILRRKRK